jgi:hypothetical protein
MSIQLAIWLPFWLVCIGCLKGKKDRRLTPSQKNLISYTLKLLKVIAAVWTEGDV